MKHRNPIAVALLPFVTLGIYSIYWEVKTKEEMNALGADIPTAWLLIVPFVSYWWLWKYSQGVEMVTGGKMQGILAFILLLLLGLIGGAVVQDSFNNIVATPGSGSPVGPVAPAMPYANPAPMPPTAAPQPPVSTPPAGPLPPTAVS